MCTRPCKTFYNYINISFSYCVCKELLSSFEYVSHNLKGFFFFFEKNVGYVGGGWGFPSPLVTTMNLFVDNFHVILRVTLVVIVFFVNDENLIVLDLDGSLVVVLDFQFVSCG